MFNLLDIIHLLFPLLGALILLFGLKLKRKNYFILSLWLSLIALILHYRASGGEILGSYFNYSHAAVYSFNLIVLITSVICLLQNSIQEFSNKSLGYAVGLFSAVLVTGTTLLLINLWINASFVEQRLAGTPILQIATFNKQPYCSYKYVFYKVGSDNVVRFMCPNHYGLLPSIGRLQTTPNFIINQLPGQLQKKFVENSR